MSDVVASWDGFDGVYIAAQASEPDNILGTGDTAEAAIASAEQFLTRGERP